MASASGVSPAATALSLVDGPPVMLTSFAGAGWPDIVLRVANQIMTDEISRKDISPPLGWGVPVTYVNPKFDIHDTMTIDPGYVRIRMAHGYMAAHDGCAGRRQRPSDPQTQADFLSTVRQTDEIEFVCVRLHGRWRAGLSRRLFNRPPNWIWTRSVSPSDNCGR